MQTTGNVGSSYCSKLTTLNTCLNTWSTSSVSSIFWMRKIRVFKNKCGPSWGRRLPILESSNNSTEFVQLPTLSRSVRLLSMRQSKRLRHNSGVLSIYHEMSHTTGVYAMVGMSTSVHPPTPPNFRHIPPLPQHPSQPAREILSCWLWRVCIRLQLSRTCAIHSQLESASPAGCKVCVSSPHHLLHRGHCALHRWWLWGVTWCHHDNTLSWCHGCHGAWSALSMPLRQRYWLVSDLVSMSASASSWPAMLFRSLHVDGEWEVMLQEA